LPAEFRLNGLEQVIIKSWCRNGQYVERPSTLIGHSCKVFGAGYSGQVDPSVFLAFSSVGHGRPVSSLIADVFERQAISCFFIKITGAAAANFLNLCYSGILA
jgi:hypothetical protein